MQSYIDEVSRDPQNTWQTRPTHDAVRHIMLLQKLEDALLMPTGVAKFNSNA
jgi:hypothetical protein